MWEALGRQLGGMLPGVLRQYGRLVGVDPLEPHGDPLEAGSAILGFRVEDATPPALLALAGRHRFSTYALTFRLDDLGDRTRLRAETRAAFPGLGGQLYKTLVIRSRGHVVAVRRIMSAVARRARSSA